MSDVVKFALLAPRRGLDAGQFSTHWSRTHARVLIGAGHREYNGSYIQNHLFAQPGERIPFQGAAQMVQRYAGNVTRGFQQDPRYLPLVRPDEHRFMDVAGSMGLFTRPVPIAGAATGGGTLKLLAFTGRTADVTAEAFAAVLDERGARAVEFAGGAVEQATHYHVLPGGARGQDRPEPPLQLDAVVEWRVAGPDALAEARAALDALRAELPAGPDGFAAAAAEVRIY